MKALARRECQAAFDEVVPSGIRYGRTSARRPTVRLLLIRHGETTWNATGRSQGQTDVALSERGMEQASALAQRLSSASIAEVVSSDLQRAAATAAAVAAEHPGIA
ncbi:MAG: hypothetical protein CL940_12000, partial [Deltaproteobacteria bacterium]|nr:hypothetical protein [Deltaproteobacteria bacterium]